MAPQGRGLRRVTKDQYFVQKKQELQRALASIKNDVSSEKDLQDNVNNFLPLFLISNGDREVVDTSTITYLKGHKPDLALKRRSYALSAVNVQATGELKYHTNSFNNSHYGEAATWMRLLLESQPWRKSTKCLLMDENRVCILEMIRQPGTSVFEGAKFHQFELFLLDSETAVYVIDDFVNGTEFVDDQIPQRYMDVATRQYHHFNLHINNVEIAAAGFNGVVYQFRHNHTELALKLVNDKNLYVNERDCLLRLQNCTSVIPLIGYNDEKKALVLPWCGDPLNKAVLLTRDKLARIVDALEAIHENGIIHRDVRLSNILCGNRHTNRLFVLIDFGLSMFCRKNESIYGKYVGSPLYSPQSHLLNPLSSSLEYGRDTDLQSLVKTWALLMFSYEAKASLLEISKRIQFNEAEDVVIRNCQQLAREWKNIFDAFPIIERAQKCALKTDYEGLKQIIATCPLFS